MLNQPMSSPMMNTMFGRCPDRSGAGLLLGLRRLREPGRRQSRRGRKRASAQQQISPFDTPGVVRCTI